MMSAPWQGYKNIAVVTNSRSSSLGTFLKSNLDAIFEGYAAINAYYIAELDPREVIRDDAVLVMTKGKARELAGLIPEDDRTIVVQRDYPGERGLPYLRHPSER